MKIMFVGDQLTIGLYAEKCFRARVSKPFPTVEQVGEERTAYDAATKKIVSRPTNLAHEGFFGATPLSLGASNNALDTAVRSLAPDLVFLLVGTNDFANKTLPPEVSGVPDSDLVAEVLRIRDVIVAHSLKVRFEYMTSSSSMTDGVEKKTFDKYIGPAFIETGTGPSGSDRTWGFVKRVYPSFKRRWVVCSVPYTSDSQVNNQIHVFNDLLEGAIVSKSWEDLDPESYDFLSLDQLNTRIWNRGAQVPDFRDVLEADGVGLTENGHLAVALDVMTKIELLTGIAPASPPPAPPPANTGPTGLVGPLLVQTGPQAQTLVFDTKHATVPPVQNQFMLPMLAGADQQVFQKQVVRPYGTIVQAASKKYGVPAPWLYGVIWGESRGDPKKRGKNGEVGVMQIGAPSLKAGHSDVDLEDPALSIDIGAKFLSQTLGKQPAGLKFLPRLASIYGSGSPDGGINPYPDLSGASPWATRERSPGYILGVVAAANSSIGPAAAAPKADSSFSWIPVVGLVVAGAFFLIPKPGKPKS